MRARSNMRGVGSRLRGTAILFAGLLAANCGGDDTSTQPEPPPSATTVQVETPADSIFVS
ncbi:MAG: hypothetical protein ACE5GJ_06670 [Gemmatimonadota bacterium]